MASKHTINQDRVKNAYFLTVKLSGNVEKVFNKNRKPKEEKEEKEKVFSKQCNRVGRQFFH